MQAPPPEQRPTRSQNAKRTVLATRMVEIVFFVVSAAVLGSLTYVLTTRQEQEDFETTFSSSARDILNAASQNVTEIYWQLVTQAAYFTSLESDRLPVPLEGYFYTPYLTTEIMREKWELQYRYIWLPGPNGTQRVPDRGGPPYTPLWIADPELQHLNLYRAWPAYRNVLEFCRDTGQAALSEPIIPSVLGEEDVPSSIMTVPLYSQQNPTLFVAAMSVVVDWTDLLGNILPPEQDSIVVQVDSCGRQNATYIVAGPDVEYMGMNVTPSHDNNQDDDLMMVSGTLTFDPAVNQTDPYCSHTFHMSPTSNFQQSSTPAIYTAAAIGMILFIVIIFVVYDVLISRQQRKTQNLASRTDALIAQLFPDTVRELLFQQESDKQKNAFAMQKQGDGDKPIAELFPEATVLFADIAGFTAWSSIREPQHVFVLLETIFQAFDKIAAKHGVYKVETVGDCYVAVVGVPENCPDHALVMARFAQDCLDKFATVVQGLELSLGPDTSDLAMRFGLHSGPVTAGVLRGDRARFQLFGDTVNKASRIESTGMRDCIHLSEQTAAMIAGSSKEDWVVPRADPVDGKEYGTIKTFWLKTHEDMTMSSSHPSGSQVDGDEKEQAIEVETDADTGTDTVHDDSPYPRSKKSRRHSSFAPNKRRNSHQDKQRRLERLVDWNCELLAQLLKQLVAHRAVSTTRNQEASSPYELLALARSMNEGHELVNEVAEMIVMPDVEESAGEVDSSTIHLDETVFAQLHLYVSSIASMYRDVPFHNFEHASHVTMSVSKLLARIVSSSPSATGNESRTERELLHDHTCGIATDPLTHFAVVVAALTHDVDHRGIPNAVLEKEDQNLASAYKGRSIAEQNSIDLAWNTLMSEGFEDLCACIFTTSGELHRFRQLLINSVIATDIFDKELGTARRKRWKAAFHYNYDSTVLGESGLTAGTSETDNAVAQPDHEMNRKATIVIEHLIQASDVAHTMQHWHVFTKWNERLFAEMYEAFLCGRTTSGKNPAEFWYKGELGFFDRYIIPLAKKLKQCGVFGTASDEYLNYALENRREWEAKGEQVVKEYVERYSH